MNPLPVTEIKGLNEEISLHIRSSQNQPSLSGSDESDNILGITPQDQLQVEDKPPISDFRPSNAQA
jgi:hypothetical protein